MSPEDLLIRERERIAEHEASQVELSAESAPEDPRADWPVLPADRTINDIVTGDRVYAFPIVRSDGTRKLMEGIVEKVVEYDIPTHAPEAINEGSPGFVNIHFRDNPWRVVGLDLNQNELIPADVMPALRRDPELREAWLDNGLSDGRRRAPELRAALDAHFAGEVIEHHEPAPGELADPRVVRETVPTSVKAEKERAKETIGPSVSEELVAQLEAEYMSRTRRNSLNVFSVAEERALVARLASDPAASQELYTAHIGLVAFLVRQLNPNGHTAELMRRGSRLLKESIQTYHPSGSSRFVDHAIIHVDERLLEGDGPVY